ncbi:hypothetical protein BU685_10510 [Staphylococcus chromogenes]|uniref:hypothetical protein n=1 Tax=Staphylococcus chromogenes TaxID=46126 RepID=UPI000D1B7D25|nr:hypothetical protein [Staphylococcus chromogenes]PTF87049.1 hypothetical protein BU685_10510 [Staphylococcus chromogenes]
MKLFKKKYDHKKDNRVKNVILYTANAIEADTYGRAIELLKDNNKHKAIEIMYERLIEAQKQEYELKLQSKKASSENFGEESPNA